jgi:hypothetical protein
VSWSGLDPVGIISASPEVIFTFGGFEDSGAGFEGVDQAKDGISAAL